MNQGEEEEKRDEERKRGRTRKKRENKVDKLPSLIF